MGFFTTTVEDIDKYRDERNVEKLIRCLTNKSEQIATASLAALGELDGQEPLTTGACADLVAGVVVSPHRDRLRETFEQIAGRDPTRFMGAVVHVMSEYVRHGMGTPEPGASSPLQLCTSYLLSCRNASLPLVRDMLSDELRVRVRFAEVLERANDESTKCQWEHVLAEERPVSDGDLKFNVPKLDEMKDALEIPLAAFTCEAAEASFMHFVVYFLGLSDESVYLAPQIVPPGEDGLYLKLPLGAIEGVEGAGGYLEIRCWSDVPNPSRKKSGGDVTRTLKFKVLGSRQGTIKRYERFLDLMKTLKGQKLKKSEVMKTFYDKDLCDPLSSR